MFTNIVKFFFFFEKSTQEKRYANNLKTDNNLFILKCKTEMQIPIKVLQIPFLQLFVDFSDIRYSKLYHIGTGLFRDITIVVHCSRQVSVSGRM